MLSSNAPFDRNLEEPSQQKGRVLIIAGSDSGGGAGIQADIKAVTALSAYAMTAVTALTAQNTKGVYEVVPVSPEFVAAQIKVVAEDIGVDAIKIGMLGNRDTALAVNEIIGHISYNHLVLDPVMVAKGGETLLQGEAIDTLITCLLPRATIITPNLPEAEILSGRRIASVDAMIEAGKAILQIGAKAVLMKGGHLAGEYVTDILISQSGFRRFDGERYVTRHTHGTGCTLSSAIAAGLAQDLVLEAAVERARRYVRLAIHHAPQLGHGHGPLNHSVTVRPFL